MKEALKLGVILFIICLISAGLLSFVYGLTKDQILNQRKNEEIQTLKQILQPAVHIEEKEGKDFIYYAGYDSNGKEIGRAAITKAKGYGADIIICVGIDKEGKIIDSKILSHSETPGLGSKVAEPAFLDKLKGRKQHDLGLYDAITGATISSTAVINAIKAKIEELVKE